MNSWSKLKLGQGGVHSDIKYLSPDFQEVTYAQYLP